MRTRGVETDVGDNVREEEATSERQREREGEREIGADEQMDAIVP